MGAHVIVYMLLGFLFYFYTIGYVVQSKNKRLNAITYSFENIAFQASTYVLIWLVRHYRYTE